LGEAQRYKNAVTLRHHNLPFYFYARGDMGREIESRQGICWVKAFKKYVFTVNSLGVFISECTVWGNFVI
jgi:hypothetical protein